MKYILKFRNKIFTNEFSDLLANDKDNVHQYTIQRKILKKIKELENNLNCEINIEETIEKITNNEQLDKQSKYLVELIYNMNLYSNIFKKREPYLLCLVWLNLKNNDILLFNRNLLDCYNINNNIECLDGRLARIFQTLKIKFITIWTYKEKIIDSMLFYINSLKCINEDYKRLCDSLYLDDNDKFKLWMINYQLVSFLNKKFTNKYLKTKKLDYQTLRNILISNYKELFQITF